MAQEEQHQASLASAAAFIYVMVSLFRLCGYKLCFTCCAPIIELKLKYHTDCHYAVFYCENSFLFSFESY
jgi:hypothetical protein